MPTFPHRTFRLTIPAFRSVRGENMQVGRDEYFVGEIGQMGTQMDGLGHVGCRLPDGDTYYNGVKSSEIEDAYGLKKLGVENAGVFFTRGVLVDLVTARKADRLPVGYEVSLAEVQTTLQQEKIKLRAGDVVARQPLTIPPASSRQRRSCGGRRCGRPIHGRRRGPGRRRHVYLPILPNRRGRLPARGERFRRGHGRRSQNVGLGK